MMKRVLITGGTSGIGLATAHRLAESQSTIVINGRNGERGAQARAAILQRSRTPTFASSRQTSPPRTASPVFSPLQWMVLARRSTSW